MENEKIKSKRGRKPGKKIKDPTVNFHRRVTPEHKIILEKYLKHLQNPADYKTCMEQASNILYVLEKHEEHNEKPNYLYTIYDTVYDRGYEESFLLIKLPIIEQTRQSYILGGEQNLNYRQDTKIPKNAVNQEKAYHLPYYHGFYTKIAPAFNAYLLRSKPDILRNIRNNVYDLEFLKYFCCDTSEKYNTRLLFAVLALELPYMPDFDKLLD